MSEINSSHVTQVVLELRRIAVALEAIAFGQPQVTSKERVEVGPVKAIGELDKTIRTWADNLCQSVAHVADAMREGAAMAYMQSGIKPDD